MDNEHNSNRRKRREVLDEKEKRYSCNECDYKTNLSGNLRQHKFIHGKEKPFSCDQCSFTTRSSGSLRNHKLRHKGGEKRYTCNECDYKTNRLGSLKQHKLIHSDESTFSCDQCSYTARQRAALYIHKLKHRKGEKRFSCNECDYKTNLLGNLKQHKLIHSKDKLFVCDKCSYETNYRRNLRKHNLIHSNEKPFSCDQCDYVAHRLSHLKKHKAIHKEKKQKARQSKNTLKPDEPRRSTELQCEDCGFNNRDERHLRDHQSQAGGDAANSKCQHCQKEFKFEGCLEYHSETSHGQEGNISEQGEDLPPPFNAIGIKCLYCEVISANVVLFLEHEMTHPFPCPRCGITFFQRSRLRQHKEQCPEVVTLK